MTTIRQSAKAYEPKTTKNIADLKSVNTELDIVDKTYTKDDGSTFTLKIATIDGEEYRVPTSVLKSLKQILEVKPGTTKFKVAKTGEGLNTEYTVIPLD